MIVEHGELVSIRDRAEAEGYQSGYQAGFDAARHEAEAASSQARAEIEEALRALRHATEKATAAIHSERRRLEEAACDLALRLAETILGHELTVASNPGADAVLRAVTHATGDGPTTVRLHPDDLAQLGDQVHLGDLAQAHAAGQCGEATAMLAPDARVVADPSVGRGGCVLEIGAAVVDASIDAALERVRAVFADARDGRAVFADARDGRAVFADDREGR
jgi:flagellar assembly protein FliH